MSPLKFCWVAAMAPPAIFGVLVLSSTSCSVATLPFFDENTPALFDTIMAGKFDFPSPEWDVISADAKSLIKDMMLVRDPKKRGTAAECLTHSFFQSTLPELTLDAASKNLKSFLLKRKFKKVGGAVMATAALARGLGMKKAAEAEAAAAAAAAKE
eukprot:Rmarinus@m.23030